MRTPTELSSKAAPVSGANGDGYGATAIETHRAARLWYPWKPMRNKRYSPYKPLLA